jgi:murein L,D-transpeptidase YcbB/YkuD
MRKFNREVFKKDCKMTYKILRLLLTFSIMTFTMFYKCGNVTEKQDAILMDSIKAEEEWNKTIPGNFSHQKTFSFDSIEITNFLKKYSDFRALDSNITRFYRNRKFSFAWFDNKGLIEQAGNLIDRVSNLKEEGLFTQPKYKAQLDSLLLENEHVNPDEEPDINLELMLTAQYFEFAEKVWQGMDKSVSESSAWFVPRKKITYEAYLDSMLKIPPNSEKNLKEPVYRQYELLKTYLQKYRTLETTFPWPAIEMDKKAYKEGDSSLFISRVKARLYHLEDFKGDTSSHLFDEALSQAIKQFQTRHGLTVDGAIGSGTLAELNTSLESRIRQLIVNMERSRWLPLSLNEDYLAVNIPEFKLHVYHSDSLLWSTNVVVGKDIHKTVVFSGAVKYIVFSPYWNIPASIVKNEILPAMARNSNYLRKNNMEIIGYQGGTPRIRQKPGPTNSLGLVKFLFPNSHSIYLHDSPAKSLFDQSSRAFSHGCIRVQEPLKLAEFLLKDEAEWNEPSIIKAMNRGVEQTITLKKQVPVFITYFTAFVDREGKINFRNDIYDRDERLAKMIIDEK